MEAIITIVGFLGAGKTTLLKQLSQQYASTGWQPFIILNDYENANLDAQQFIEKTGENWVKTLSGSCICCSGIHVLRDFVNAIPERPNGITLIEANGTTDASALMGFLGVGINDRFMPPVQISVVDVKNWQKRGEHNDLEANQIQLSSQIILTHLDQVTANRKQTVIDAIRLINPKAEILTMASIDIHNLSLLSPSENTAEKLDHLKAHWASSSIDLPQLPNQGAIIKICNELPDSILRIKGCVKIGKDETYTYFERTPDGHISSRPFNGIPPFGTKLLSVGLGSSPALLETAVKTALK